MVGEGGHIVFIVFDIIMLKRPLFQTQYHHHDVQSLVDQSVNNGNCTRTKKSLNPIAAHINRRIKLNDFLMKKSENV